MEKIKLSSEQKRVLRWMYENTNIFFIPVCAPPGTRQNTIKRLIELKLIEPSSIPDVYGVFTDRIRSVLAIKERPARNIEGYLQGEKTEKYLQGAWLNE